MIQKISQSSQSTKYEQIVAEYLSDNGSLVVYSDDQNFIKLIQYVVYKQLSISTKCLYCSSDVTSIFNYLQKRQKNQLPSLLFIEREINRSSTNDVIKQMKSHFDELKVIVLTDEAEKSLLVLLYELGVDNFITKPLTINTLVEKIAFTVQPPGKLGQMIEAAKTHLAHGEYESALEQANRVLEIKPNSPAGLMVLGDAYKQLDQHEQAVGCYQKAHQSERMYLEPLKKLSECYREAGQKNEELKSLKKLNELSPLNVDRKMFIGEIELDLGNADGAEYYFEEAVKLIKKQAREDVSKINLEIAEKLLAVDPERSEKYYRKAIESRQNVLDKNDVSIFNRLGIALRKQGKPKDAVAEYKRALQLSPEDGGLYYNIAMAYLEGKEYKLAESAIRKALEKSPQLTSNNEIITYNIAMIYYFNRRPEQAIDLFRQALSINQDYEPAQKMLNKLKPQ